MGTGRLALAWAKPIPNLLEPTTPNFKNFYLNVYKILSLIVILIGCLVLCHKPAAKV